MRAALQQNGRAALVLIALAMLAQGCPNCAATTEMASFAREQGNQFVFYTPRDKLFGYAREELAKLGYQVPDGDVGRRGNLLGTRWLDEGSTRSRYVIAQVPATGPRYHVVTIQITQWRTEDKKDWQPPDEQVDGNFTWGLIERADPARFAGLNAEAEERGRQAAASCEACRGGARTVGKHLPEARPDNPMKKEFDETMRATQQQLDEIQRELHLDADGGE